MTQRESFPAKKHKNLVVAMLAELAGDFVRDQLVRVTQHQDSSARLPGFNDKIVPITFIPTPVPSDRELVAPATQRRE